MNIQSDIHSLLKRTEVEKNIAIQYACESGSRAWGFASPNSDYDIRFLYLSAAQDYFSVFERKDTIEIPIKDDLDPGGWDIKKALYLLASSNGALIEWLHSPIVYHEEGDFRKRWQSLVKEVLNPKHLINHYRGLAVQVRKKKLEAKEPSAKGYLYACRALLAAQWVERNQSPPPVPFAELVATASPTLKNILEETVVWKATADEVASMGHIKELDAFISGELLRDDVTQNIPEPCSEFVKERLDCEFQSFLNI